MIEVMRKMREDRGGAIQSADQLEYSYASLVRFIRNHKQVCSLVHVCRVSHPAAGDGAEEADGGGPRGDPDQDQGPQVLPGHLP